MKELFEHPFYTRQPFDRLTTEIIFAGFKTEINDVEVAKNGTPGLLEALIISRLKTMREMVLASFDKQIAAIEASTTEEG